MLRPTGRRIAWLIGIEAYSHLPELRTPYQDVRLLSTGLARLGFDVIELAESARARDAAALRDGLAELVRRIEAMPAGLPSEPAACVLIYFAGHGVVLAGHACLVSETADPSSDGALRAGSLAVHELVAALAVRLDVPKVLLVDACRGALRSRAFVPEAQFFGILPGDMVIDFATHPGEIALEGNAHSPYALALSEHLSDPVSITDMLVNVTARVRELTAMRQSPMTYVSLGVRLTLASARQAPSTRPSADLRPEFLARCRDRVMLFQSRDRTGHWAWYAVLVDEGREREFARAVAGSVPVDIEEFGVVLASSYGETLSHALRQHLKRRYGL